MSRQAFKAACIQMNSGTAVTANVAAASDLIRAAAAAGAHYVQTPEMTTIVERDRAALEAAIAFSQLAKELKIWLHIGSMPIALPPTQSGPTIANRAFLFRPDGRIAATYDKIHMYDVDLDNGESWRESNTYRAGTKARLVDMIVDRTPVRLGISICYDLRFPAMFRTYAKAGATVLGTPAVFTRQTGEAHWHVLQRARAIENAAFMVSAAQAGSHQDGRETYGHSMIVDPWGVILAEADSSHEAVIAAEIEPGLAEAARRKIPALTADRSVELQIINESAAA